MGHKHGSSQVLYRYDTGHWHVQRDRTTVKVLSRHKRTYMRIEQSKECTPSASSPGSDWVAVGIV